MKTTVKMQKAIAKLEKKYGELEKTFGNDNAIEKKTYYDFCDLHDRILQKTWTVNSGGEVWQ